MRFNGRMSLNRVLLLISIFLLLSCSYTLREELLEEHPEWSEKHVKMIEEGNITEGMSKDMVLAAWGHPKRDSEVAEPSFSYRWVYETATPRSYSSTYVYFKDGKVVKIDSGN